MAAAFEASKAAALRGDETALEMLSQACFPGFYTEKETEQILQNIAALKHVSNMPPNHSSAQLPKKSHDAKNKFYTHVQTLGPALYHNKRVLQGLISDLFVHDEKLKNILLIAVEYGISVEVANLLSLDKSMQKIILSRIIDSFAEKYSIEQPGVIEAVKTLACGLSIDSDNCET